jgi:glycosyltransferase involved in cell wall biosynthesis
MRLVVGSRRSGVRWVALVESPQHVCCRYRISAFQPLLELSGYSLEIRALPRRWWTRLAFYPQLRGSNVILQRKLLPAWELALLRRQVHRLVFDFDDALFLRDSFAAKGLHDRRRLRRFAATVRACDVVVAGNAFLASEAARYTDSALVRVIPTCVDPAHYQPLQNKPISGTVNLVWIGSSSTLQGLEKIAPLLEELGRTVPNLGLKVICDRFPALQHMAVWPCRWSEATEAADLASADVGISWIPDDLWSRGKCGLKVLQYMAAGLPVVANAIGVHGEIIRHGETGFLVETPAEWVSAIRALTTDPQLRQRIGAAGRQMVEVHYGVRSGARAWLELLDALDRQKARAG